ncbi:MAG: AAA family ATPase [Planctomycetes bacterium]|nr:AAA family ATPase [Planctomycetota bacterium]
MKLEKITIKNVRSFKSQTPVSFGEKVSILIGPNAGGKSNLLDIITIAMRSFLFKTYAEYRRERNGYFYTDIEEKSVFKDTSIILEKFSGDDSDSSIIITIRPSHEDLLNMRMIQDNTERFLDLLGTKYKNKPLSDLSFLATWDFEDLEQLPSLSYRYINNQLQSPELATPADFYLQYLQYFDFFLLLSRRLPDIDLKPTFLYFSPYRQATQESLRISLSGQTYSDLLTSYFGSTSHSPQTTIIQLATSYFAQKRREYEIQGRTEGWENSWINDEEVGLLTKYLNLLGYDWDMEILHDSSNIYAIQLKRGSSLLELNRASSGEKEIVNFLMGIFSFNIRNGLIIIDEPELHLHPKWQRTLIDLFQTMAEDTGNQFILATHSPALITEKTIDSVLRVYSDNTGSSKVMKIVNESIGDARDILHIVNSHHNEKLFFADRVVLVEGPTDRLIFESMIGKYLAKKEIVIEVLDVGGKHNFDKYINFLNSIEVKNAIVGDLDYVFDIGNEVIKKLFLTDYQGIDEKIIKKKKSKDRKTLAEKLESALETNQLGELKEFWKYLKSRQYKLRGDLSRIEKQTLDDFINELRERLIFILRQGEIEDYLPDGYKDLDGVIELVIEENFDKWLKDMECTEGLEELKLIVRAIIDA